MFVLVGLRSILRIIIKHFLAAARDEIYKVLHLHTFSQLLTCFNSIGKRNMFMHILDVVLVHTRLCNFMKRTLALVKVWFVNMLFFFVHFIRFFIGFLMLGCINHAVAR